MTSAVRAAASGGEIQRTITPVDGSVYVERPLATRARSPARSSAPARRRPDGAGAPSRSAPRSLSGFVDAFVARRDEIAAELTWQMGRPIRYTPGEVRGFEERARHMIAIAPQALADHRRRSRRRASAASSGASRSASCSSIAPWNYPYLTAVNAVVPALMAGNAVVLKHSRQTPLCAERFAEACEGRRAAGRACSRPCTCRRRRPRR